MSSDTWYTPTGRYAHSQTSTEASPLPYLGGGGGEPTPSIVEGPLTPSPQLVVAVRVTPDSNGAETVAFVPDCSGAKSAIRQIHTDAQLKKLQDQVETLTRKLA